MIQLKKILVPIDFSEYSKDALRYAIMFAERFGAELVLIYVVEPMVYPADFSFGQVSIPNMEIELTKMGNEQLEKLITDEVASRVKAKRIVRTGKAFVEIIKTAREENIDLIVISTRGQSGVEHILFGSTAEKVSRKAPCPVLTVRSAEHKFVMP
jgi:nucleotide-binding universal stress UspA family protein